MQTTQPDGRTLVRLTDREGHPIEIEETQIPGMITFAQVDDDPLVLDRHLAARLARQLDAFARTGTLQMNEIDVSTNEPGTSRERIEVAQLGPVEGATYLRVGRVETGPVGRAWNVVLADGRHLGGVFAAEVLGDLKEGTQLVLHLRAHDIEIVGSKSLETMPGQGRIPSNPSNPSRPPEGLPHG